MAGAFRRRLGDGRVLRGHRQWPGLICGAAGGLQHGRQDATDGVHHIDVGCVGINGRGVGSAQRLTLALTLTVIPSTADPLQLDISQDLIVGLLSSVQPCR